MKLSPSFFRPLPAPARPASAAGRRARSRSTALVLLAATVLPALPGCAVVGRFVGPPLVTDPPPLAPPVAAFPGSGDGGWWEQDSSLAFLDQRLAFPGLLRISAEGTELLALTPAGPPLFRVRQTPAAPTAPTLEANGPLPPGFSAPGLIADVQMAYWPTAALEKAWAGSGWTLDSPGPHTRRIALNKRLVVEVHCPDAPCGQGVAGRVWLANIGAQYTVFFENRPLVGGTP